MATRHSIILVAAALLLAASVGTADARIYPSQGQDQRTGKHYRGVAVLSQDKRAQLHFLCAGKTSVPRITFNNSRPLAPVSLPFKLTYRIGDGPKQFHYFLVESDPRRGHFYVRHTENYVDRFGKAPRFADPETKLVSKAFRNWVDTIHHAVVGDFAHNEQASVRVVGQSGTSFSYTFNLDGLEAALPHALPCWDPERGAGATPVPKSGNNDSAETPHPAPL